MAIRIAALFLLVLASFASSDEVTLKDGRVLEGEIIEENDKTLKLKMKMGAMTIQQAEVAGIVRKATPAQEYSQRLANLNPKVAEEQIEIGLFARNHEMNEEAIQHFLAAWRLDPKSSVAAAELNRLDYHFVQGGWQSPDDYYPGLGYLKLDNKWYKPLEHAWRLATREVERKEGERRVAEAAVNKARAAISTAGVRVKEATARIDKLDREIDELKVKLESARDKVSESQRTVKTLAASPELSSENYDEKANARAALGLARTKLEKARREAEQLASALESKEKEVQDAGAEIDQIGVEKVEGEKNVEELQKQHAAAEEAILVEKAKAEQAKQTWEKSR